MKIAIHGLGRMGSQITKKLSEDGHEVIAHNRSKEPIDEAVDNGAQAAYEKHDVLDAFKNEQLVLWLMLPAEVIGEELDKWLELVPKNSLFIDGGNSDFRLTKERAEKIEKAGSTLLDVGTSGGILGLKQGFSMMVGGSQDGFKKIEPLLQTISKPRGGYEHFGASGSGHFVKMVHNAVEYGMMESLAEGYRMLKEGPCNGLDLAKAATVWQKASVVESTLNELCRQELAQNPELNGIGGVVEEKGETRWTLEVAKDISLPMPAIQTAMDVRIASQNGEVSFATKLLAAMRNRFGGHQINPDKN
ncbi:MAG TPA: NADP-dependent phosphogluconate dehydrogenase [Candidatus Saccharimonadales bacterium]|nr:NADP-dependent phosphogluconate dehydrogenase [Candidatus Saccharimonadales bacterium]